MKGTERFVSDSNPASNDSAFQSRRIMIGSQFDFNRAEQSQPSFSETPPLDMRRAESSRLHVRALNTQFASWVQIQLQNHPDELWEDGVRDYLTHASNIMEKFSDVVKWIKANAAKAETLSVVGSQDGQKKLDSERKENEIASFSAKPLIATAGTSASFTEKPRSTSAGTSTLFSEKPWSNSAGTSASFSEKPWCATTGTSTFTTSWSSGTLFNSQSPFSFDDVEQPSSPSVKKTEEKGVIIAHEVKCKLYVKSSDPADTETWKDKGTGQLSIKYKKGFSKGSKDSKPAILVRNDVGNVLLNALLYPGIKTSVQKNSIVAIFHTAVNNPDIRQLFVSTRLFCCS